MVIRFFVCWSGQESYLRRPLLSLIGPAHPAGERIEVRLVGHIGLDLLTLTPFSLKIAFDP